MRRIVPAAAAAVVVLAILAIPASARIDHHFSVITKQISSHQSGDTLHFRDQLFATFNPDDQVGNDRVRCREGHANKFKCRATIHLNGEVGGEGFLFVNGNFGHGDKRLNVVGGTGDFAGAAGKVLAVGRGLTFDLVG
jgi:hypothetical protein